MTDNNCRIGKVKDKRTGRTMHILPRAKQSRVTAILDQCYDDARKFNHHGIAVCMISNDGIVTNRYYTDGSHLKLVGGLERGKNIILENMEKIVWEDEPA